MSNKIVICYDLYEADSTLRDKVVKILKEKNYVKVKNIDTLWEKVLSQSEESALKEFIKLKNELKDELSEILKSTYTTSDLMYGNKKLNIKFYLSIKDREEEI